MVGGRNDAVARKRRAIIATSIGNMLEWYDFIVYALFADYIAGNFFPATDDPTTKLIKTFMVFGLGFVVRPLGAILIGNYGDRAGRKAALTLTILLMGAGTAVIAYLVKAVIGLRPTLEVESAGLDLAEHGEEGYHGAES